MFEVLLSLMLLIILSSSYKLNRNQQFRVYRTLVFPCGYVVHFFFYPEKENPFKTFITSHFHISNTHTHTHRSGIGLEIADALKSLKEVELVGATSTSTTPTHCPYVFPKVYDDLPTLKQDTYLVERLISIINDEQIDVLFPGLDDATTFLSKHRYEIESSTGAKIMLPPHLAVQIARSKKLTYERFKDIPNVPVPKVYDRWRETISSLPYSVFLKPEKGQGSQGARRVDTPTELRVYANSITLPMVMEYLPGDEYTVDCFADRVQGLLFARARRRVRIRGGISVATEPMLIASSSSIDEGWVRTMATTIQQNLKMHGAFFFQVKKNSKGLPILMEIAPRIAGAMAMFRSFGVNLPLLTIYEAFRLPLKIMTPKTYDVKIMDKAYSNRYQVQGLDYDNVYVDLDDTLILREQIHTNLVRFLFQCVNRNKQIVLVTRSVKDPKQVLRQFRLFELFDRVLHIKDRSVAKSVVILRDMKESCLIDDDDEKERKSIFIDDSYKERRDVFENVGIPVFDLSMLNVLIDSLVL